MQTSSSNNVENRIKVWYSWKENRMGNMVQGLFQGAGGDILAERAERSARRCSLRLAFRAFSSARASFTLVSSDFNLDWSYKTVSTDGLTDTAKNRRTGCSGPLFESRSLHQCIPVPHKSVTPNLINKLNPHLLLQFHPKVLKHTC